MVLADRTAAAREVVGHAAVRDHSFAKQPVDVVGGGRIRHPREHDLGEVVGEQRIGEAAVGRVDLCLRLPNGHQQDPDARARGRDLRQPARRGVAGLVENEQRRRQRPATTGTVVRLREQVADEPAEHGRQARLVVKGRAQVEGVRAAAQPLEVDLVASGRRGHARVGPGLHQRLRGRVHARPCAVVEAPHRGERPVGREGVGPAQGIAARELTVEHGLQLAVAGPARLVLDEDPARHVGHRGTGAVREVQGGPHELLRQGTEEVEVFRPAARCRVTERPRDPLRRARGGGRPRR